MQYKLFGGCYRSKICVSPKNWKTQKASTKKDWRIYYRFYDPERREHWGYQVAIRGMNEFKNLIDRQNHTTILLEGEIHKLDILGWNPIQGIYMAPAPSAQIKTEEITGDSSFSETLRFALKNCRVDEDTRTDMKSTVKYVIISAGMLKMNEISIKDIKRTNIRAILNNCENIVTQGKDGKKVKKIWNANQFNHYRKYLLILYNYLESEDILEYNPIHKLEKEEVIIDEDKRRDVLTIEQQKRVDTYLKERDPDYRRFVHIFHRSGSRIKEIFKVEGKHVDIPRQRFRILIKKRKKKTWVYKTITDQALPFWIEAMKGCGKEDYVFSIGFRPGRKIRPEQATRRWRKYVKEELGIKVDLYSLKHLHTTDMIDELEKTASSEEAVKQAAKHNSHTTTKMVAKVYDIKNVERRVNRQKSVKTTFGSKAG